MVTSIKRSIPVRTQSQRDAEAKRLYRALRMVRMMNGGRIR